MLRFFTISIIFFILLSEAFGQRFNKNYSHNARAGVSYEIYPAKERNLLIGTIKDIVGNYALEKSYISVLSDAGDIVKTYLFGDSLKSYQYQKSLTKALGGFYYLSGTSINTPFSSDKRKNETGFIIKTDSNFNVVWEKHYYDDDSLTDYIFANGIALDDSTVIICGHAYHYSDTTRKVQDRIDVFIIKIDKTGNIIRKKVFPKGNSVLKANKPYLCLNEKNGELLIICDFSTTEFVTSPSKAYASAWIFSIDTAGNTLWDYTTPDPKVEMIFPTQAIIPTKDKGYIFGGAFGRLVQSGSKWDVEAQGMVCKLDSATQQIVWMAKLDTSYTSGISNLWQLENGDILASGAWRSKPFIGWIVKLSSTGKLIWDRRYSLLQDEQGLHTLSYITVDNRGNIFACGNTNDILSTNPPIQRSWVLKLDSMGCLLPGCGTNNINNINLSNVVLYPNPATNHIYLSIKSQQAKIVDITGKQLWQGAFSQEGIDISFLTPGLYYLKTETGTTRFIKE